MSDQGEMMPATTWLEYFVNYYTSDTLTKEIINITDEDDLDFDNFNTGWMDYDFYKLK